MIVMKKNLFYLFALICSMSLFTACNSDDEEERNASAIVGTYSGGLDIVMTPETGESTIIATGITKNVSISEVSGNEIKMELKDFSLQLGETLLDLKTITIDKCQVTRSGSVYSFSGQQDLIFTGAAAMLGTCATSVSGTITDNKIAMKIDVNVTTLKQKVKVDFNGALLSTGNGVFYGFETWVKGVEDQEPDMTFYEVAGGWSSSNTGAHFLKAFAMADKYLVTQTDDAHSGKGAAKIESIDTKGADMGFVKVPRVTTGTLFLGAFVTDITNTLNSTKFGIEYNKKPISLSGYYKYTPGETFYRCESPATCHIAVEDPKTTDQCMISAILYEVNSYNDPEYKEFLTGVDAYTSAKIVAIGQLKDGTAKTAWTKFDIKLDYKKAYDSTKKYRFSIICSSSKDGDNFNGAPGSTLLVDDFELVAE